MHDSVELERRGLPTAVIVTSEFLLEARAQRDALGMKELEPVVIDHPVSSLTSEDIRQRADAALPLIEQTWLGRTGEGVVGTPPRAPLA